MMEQVQASADTNECVLVVDDDPILCAIAERHLQKSFSAQVVIASDGMQALQVLDGPAHDPSFILCDLNMPNMDGLEFLRHLEQRKFAGSIAILSGEDQSIIALAESLAKAHNLDVVGTLSKPIKADELTALVKNARTTRSAPEQPSRTVVTASDLHRAITTGKIVAYHQPKVHAQSGRFVGTEALARWHHSELGVVPPVHFISLAEQNGLIEHLTSTVLNDAITHLRSWRIGGIEAACSVNLSPEVLANIDLPDELAARVDSAGLAREQFVFEITESGLLQKDAVPMEVLARLRLKGFDLSVDDFGTGHSNIETLRNFPFSELKIDRSFVSAMLDDAFAAESVRASVELGRHLNLRLVAEGVESQSVWDAVKQLGIDQAQGFLFGKPMPGDELPRWLNEYQNASSYQTVAAQ